MHLSCVFKNAAKPSFGHGAGASMNFASMSLNCTYSVVFASVSMSFHLRMHQIGFCDNTDRLK